MKEINEIVKVVKPVEYIEESQIFYVSDDGNRKSKNIKEIEDYEKEQKYKQDREKRYKNIKKIEKDWTKYFYIENKEDAEFLIDYLHGNTLDHIYINGVENRDLSNIIGWISYDYYEDSNGYDGIEYCCRIYTEETLKVNIDKKIKEKEHSINILKEIKDEIFPESGE